MPVYLVHGFRWPREGFTGIRVHAVINNLDDVSVEYIQNANSRRDLLRSFRTAYPEIMKELDHSDPDSEVYMQPGMAGTKGGRRLEFIEQYNPEDVDGPYAVSQPYAYVGDKVVVIAAASPAGMRDGMNGGPGTAQQPDSPGLPRGRTPGRSVTQPMSKSAPFNSPADITALSVNVEEVLADGPGLTNKAWEALADLRDKIAEGEKIGWWVVYNGDPERFVEEVDDEDEDEDGDECEYEYDYESEDEEVEVEDVRGFKQQQQQPQNPDRGGPRRAVATPVSPATVRSAESSAAARGHRPTGSENAPIPTSFTGMGTYPISTPAVQVHQHIASPQRNHARQQQPQQQQPQRQRQLSSPGLTALPVRPSPPLVSGPTLEQASLPAAQASRSRPNTAASTPETKGKQKDRERDVPTDPAKLKEISRSQGLRKKFFGRRT
ncbi:hypothetical protein A1O7_07690 [Cladophialophora yegresii CBS 114405]|uniref:Uncharacterized protein n=1 Tax=Cladophialophora yegresii CBS 114405 TaxID=1182544 RepID=W9VP96_9EURO|nr:uncharacterized protein A1O7_07690 [Cladophialophora yegresii CBS 114405]EXJ57343.1 hypothetical protein A1O7_07690 [Cladophialophora yegresii CBS 114405]